MQALHNGRPVRPFGPGWPANRSGSLLRQSGGTSDGRGRWSSLNSRFGLAFLSFWRSGMRSAIAPQAAQRQGPGWHTGWWAAEPSSLCAAPLRHLLQYFPIDRVPQVEVGGGQGREQWAKAVCGLEELTVVRRALAQTKKALQQGPVLLPSHALPARAGLFTPGRVRCRWDGAGTQRPPAAARTFGSSCDRLSIASFPARRCQPYCGCVDLRNTPKGGGVCAPGDAVRFCGPPGPPCGRARRSKLLPVSSWSHSPPHTKMTAGPHPALPPPTHHAPPADWQSGGQKPGGAHSRGGGLFRRRGHWRAEAIRPACQSRAPPPPNAAPDRRDWHCSSGW